VTQLAGRQAAVQLEVLERASSTCGVPSRRARAARW